MSIAVAPKLNRAACDPSQVPSAACQHATILSPGNTEADPPVPGEGLSADLAGCCRRTPRHTTHHQHVPERVTITRPHHPFEGQSLEVLRQARMPAGLQFVLILPDGSKSLVPAAWTDFTTPAGPSQTCSLVGSLDDFLRLRGLTDALLHRSAGLPVTSGASQEGHATTEPELRRSPDPGSAPVGAVRRRAKTSRHRDSVAPLRPSNAEPPAGADQ